jgi:ATP-dependent DNA helicase RecG
MAIPINIGDNSTSFGDSINRGATIEDISSVLVREYLQRIKSPLLNDFFKTKSFKEIYHEMNLIEEVDGIVYPRNMALLLFNSNPENFFPGARIEFSGLPSNSLSNPNRQPIIGSIYLQIGEALQVLRTYILKERIYKRADRAEADRNWNYPEEALEQAIVNAIHHKNYLINEPIKIRILPERIEIVNPYNAERTYDNQRIGDALIKLKLDAGTGKGISLIRWAMKRNSSPEPIFERDDTLGYFKVILLRHPVFNNM